MMPLWIKKIIYTITLAPAALLSTPVVKEEPKAATQEEIQEIRSENELSGLEERFQEDQSFDATQVNQALQLRVMEAGAVMPLKANIEAMLTLWDAGVRDPHMFVAALLKDTTIDQTIVVHLYGPEVSALLNEMNSNDSQNMSEKAQQIVAAFQK